ncbi:Uncharacterised protein [Mycobacteroides abscessus subsp. abscessus]|nr:Uncharacterised protein [Mycobacteroides abscessus subsp. abscessus]
MVDADARCAYRSCAYDMITRTANAQARIHRCVDCAEIDLRVGSTMISDRIDAVIAAATSIATVVIDAEIAVTAT